MENKITATSRRRIENGTRPTIYGTAATRVLLYPLLDLTEETSPTEEVEDFPY